MPQTQPIHAWQLSPGQRKALSWCTEHFAPRPPSQLFAELVDMGLLTRGAHGRLGRTLAGKRVYEEMAAAHFRLGERSADDP